MISILLPRQVQPRAVNFCQRPPGHRKNWKKHCGEYHACGTPVYFVKDEWYDSHVKPGKGNGKGNGKGHGKG